MGFILRSGRLGVGLCVGILLMVGAAQAQGISFSGDMVTHMKKKTATSKVAVSGQKMRMEMAGNIIITRLDKDVAWIIMPSEKMYMEQAIDRTSLPKTETKMEGEISRESLGMETVNGQQAEKFKVTYTEDGKTKTMYQWIKDGMIPLKMESEDGSWGMEYQNLSTAPVPEDAFEVPAGYSKFAMPSLGGAMKGLMPFKK